MARRPVSVARGRHRRRRAGLGARAQRADARRARRRALRADAHRGAGGARHRRPHPVRAAPRRVPVQLLARRGATRAGCGGAPRWRATAPTTPTGTSDRPRRAGRGRRRELGVGGRRGHRTRLHAGAGRACPAAAPTPRSCANSTCAQAQFVDDGFELPEAKTDIAWEDEDTVLVGTDFGPGSLTESGYPRIVKRWRRGQPLAEAETVFAGDASDVSVGAAFDPTPASSACSSRGRSTSSTASATSCAATS